MLVKCRTGAAIAILALVLVSNLGCWGRKFFRMPGETLDTAEKVDSLLRENDILQRRVYYLEKKLEEQINFARNNTAANKIDIEEIKDQLNALQQMMGEREGARSGDRRMDADRVVREGRREPVFPPPGDSVVSAEKPPGEADTSLTSQPAVSPDTPGEGDTLRAGESDFVQSPERLRQRVYLEYNRSNYRLALEESRLFLDEYPRHPLGEDVHFIRGECFIELGEHFDALREFSLILQQYPDGDYAPPSLLRMVIAYQAIGESELAAGVARRLIREYPYSEEADVARERFADILEQ